MNWWSFSLDKIFYQMHLENFLFLDFKQNDFWVIWTDPSFGKLTRFSKNISQLWKKENHLRYWSFCRGYVSSKEFEQKLPKPTWNGRCFMVHVGRHSIHGSHGYILRKWKNGCFWKVVFYASGRKGTLMHPQNFKLFSKKTGNTADSQKAMVSNQRISSTHWTNLSSEDWNH